MKNPAKYSAWVFFVLSIAIVFGGCSSAGQSADNRVGRTSAALDTDSGSPSDDASAGPDGSGPSATLGTDCGEQSDDANAELDGSDPGPWDPAIVGQVVGAALATTACGSDSCQDQLRDDIGFVPGVPSSITITDTASVIGGFLSGVGGAIAGTNYTYDYSSGDYQTLATVALSLATSADAAASGDSGVGSGPAAADGGVSAPACLGTDNSAQTSLRLRRATVTLATPTTSAKPATNPIMAYPARLPTSA